MKKVLTFALASALSLNFCLGCGNQAAPETTADPEPTVSQAAVDALDGKKIIFLGNSFTFHGYAIKQIKENVLAQTERVGDEGFFYQLCKRAGAEVSITNWCFGGHDITDYLGGPCGQKKDCQGQDHAAFLTDRNFDYVALQLSVEKKYEGDLAAHLQPVMDMFREANPNVKFLLLVPHMAYDQNYKWAQDVEALKGSDILICNWGKMLEDIVKGEVQVPGAKQSYARPTFVISQDEKDGYHQNVLAGYLTAAMVYSAITGESAQGLPYDFCDDTSVHPQFDLEDYKARKYVYEPYTNFVEVFRSPEDMAGLQQLVDQYIAKYNP